MNFTFLISTAFAVSIDSFFAGFSLNLRGSGKKQTLIITTAVIFVMCLFGNLLGKVLSGAASEKFTVIGGVILSAVGLFEIFFSDKDDKKLKPSVCTLSESCLIGLGVGIDGCIADISLAVMGYSQIYVPVLIAFMHLILIDLGMALNGRINFNKNKWGNIPPIVLLALGLYKIVMSV